MLRYVVKRILMMVITLFAVATITFIMMHVAPGGPFSDQPKTTPEQQAALAEKYKLNDPLIKQYADYMAGVVRLDFGPSYKYLNRDVSDLIAESYPVSFQIGALAIVFMLAVSIPMGILSALRHEKFADRLMMFFATLGVTVPSFIIATLLLYLFSMVWQVLPTFWRGDLLSFILPVFCMAAYSVSFVSRLTRSSLLDVMGQDYIRTARAKGLPESKVITRHALRNALMPVVTILGPLTAGLVTGSFVIEQIFAIPGIGHYFVDSITNRDYSMIMGITMFYAIFIVILVAIVDIIYHFLDPRIKFD